MAGVTDGAGNTSDTESINEDLAVIRTAYQSKRADGQLTIVPLKPDQKPDDLYMDWIR